MYIKPAEGGDGAFGCKAPVSPVRRQNEQPPLKWTLVLSCIWLMNYWCEPTAASGRGLVGCDLLHATIWSVPHAPEYHTMGGAGVRCLAGSAPTSGIAHTTASPGNKTLLNVVAKGPLKMSFGFRFACYFNLITLEMFTIHFLPSKTLTQILMWCFQVAQGAACLAEGLVCGGDFHLSGVFRLWSILYPPGLMDNFARS